MQSIASKNLSKIFALEKPPRYVEFQFQFGCKIQLQNVKKEKDYILPKKFTPDTSKLKIIDHLACTIIQGKILKQLLGQSIFSTLFFFTVASFKTSQMRCVWS